jgi:hypothetical protein
MKYLIYWSKIIFFQWRSTNFGCSASPTPNIYSTSWRSNTPTTPPLRNLTLPAPPGHQFASIPCSVGTSKWRTTTLTLASWGTSHTLLPTSSSRTASCDWWKLLRYWMRIWAWHVGSNRSNRLSASIPRKRLHLSTATSGRCSRRSASFLIRKYANRVLSSLSRLQEIY